MSCKKWFLMLLSALLLVLAVCVLLNVIVDPFQAFGHSFLRWDSYAQTLNPRNSKAIYVTEHSDSYDSYVIGSSSAASYLPQTLEKYFGGSFYNLFHYGADSAYDCALVRYLMEKDDVRRIVLVLGLSEAYSEPAESVPITERTYYPVSGESRFSYLLHFLTASPNYAVEKLTSLAADTEMPQSFDVFFPESGVYDKRLRDAEPIGTLDSYLALHGEDYRADKLASRLPFIETAAQSVAEIRRMCEAEGAELLVILAPTSQQQLERFAPEELNRYYAALSEVTDYWNFSVSPISYDPRFFYDVTHTRNAASDMVLARIAGDPDAVYPDAFGVYCENGSCADVSQMRKASETSAFSAKKSVTVPILLYHHLDAEQAESSTVLRPERFAHQMELLLENGFHTIDFDELTAFVERGEPLPENPVLVTFDDGYLSNYTYAFPVLEENRQKATIFAIGSSIGHEKYYKDTAFELTPHFGQQQIDEMQASGCICVGSHTYDMHQWPPFETTDRPRRNILPLEGESERDYIQALTEDCERQKQTFRSFGIPEPTVIAYPEGESLQITDVIVRACGYRVTLTTDENRINTVISGLPQSLIGLGRMTVLPEHTDADLLAYLRTSAK